MEHPRKRRRTETPSNISDQDSAGYNEDLHPEIQERLDVRNRFKSQLERIFEKYGKDFTGVGDEIDLVTGEVVIDNGHLLHMQEEDDVGDDAFDQDESSEEEEDFIFDENEKELPVPLGKIRDCQGEDGPLESLHVGQKFAAQTYTPKFSSQIILSPAKDPIWQVPNIPECESSKESDDEEQPAGLHSGGQTCPMTYVGNKPRRVMPKSPGGSLWSLPKSRVRISDRPSKVWRSRNVSSSNANNENLSRPETEVGSGSVQESQEISATRGYQDFDDYGSESDTTEEPFHEAFSQTNHTSYGPNLCFSQKQCRPIAHDTGDPTPGKIKPRRSVTPTMAASLAEHTVDGKNRQVCAVAEGNSEPQYAMSIRGAGCSQASPSQTDLMPNGLNQLIDDAPNPPLSLRKSRLQRSWSPVPNGESSDVNWSHAELLSEFEASVSSGRIDQPYQVLIPSQETLRDARCKKRSKTMLRTWSVTNTTQDAEYQELLKSATSSNYGQSMKLVKESTTVHINDHDSRQTSGRIEQSKLMPKSSQSCLSRESSPLSSLSSSDPRMAASFDAQSAKEIHMARADFHLKIGTEGLDVLIDTPAEGIDYFTTLKLQEAHRKDTTALQGSLELSQKPLTPSKIPNPASDPPKITSHPNVSNELKSIETVESTRAQTKSIIPIQQLSEQGEAEPDPPNLSVNDMSDLFQSMNESFAQSQILLKASAKSKLTDPQASGVRSRPRGTNPVNKPFIPVKPRLSSNGTNLAQPDYSSSKKDIISHEKLSTRPATENKAPARSVDRNMPAGAIKGRRSGQVGGLTCASIPKTKLAIIQSGGKFSGGTAGKRDSAETRTGIADRPDVPRYNRETTPVDTYCYTLADPWFEEPLPGDRIPGLEASKERELTPRKEHPDIMPQPPTFKAAARSSDVKNCQNAPKRSDISDQHQNLDSKRDDSSISSTYAGGFHQTELGKESSSRSAVSNIPIKLPAKTKPVRTRNESRDRPRSMKLDIVKSRIQSSLLNSEKLVDQFPLPETPGRLPADGSAPSARRSSPAYQALDIMRDFGKGRPLTKANLLSQDEVPSTSQDTVMSFLNSQTPTKVLGGPPTVKSSQLAYQSHRQYAAASSTKACGKDGYRCERRYCFNCTSKAATQEEIEF